MKYLEQSLKNIYIAKRDTLKYWKSLFYATFSEIGGRQQTNVDAFEDCRSRRPKVCMTTRGRYIKGKQPKTVQLISINVSD